MVEKEAHKEKEAELVVPLDLDYKEPFKQAQLQTDTARKGKKLIKGKAIPFTLARQAIHRVYSRDWTKGLTNNNWNIFIHEIRTHSGRHVHQGGLTLFVLKGKGYTVVDGRRFDWQDGDLICLPVKRGGCEHQHFNVDNKPSRWLAFIYHPYHFMLGRQMDQKENNPFWKEPVEK